MPTEATAQNASDFNPSLMMVQSSLPIQPPGAAVHEEYDDRPKFRSRILGSTSMR